MLYKRLSNALPEPFVKLSIVPIQKKFGEGSMPAKRVCPACHADFIKGRRVLFAARTGARMATVCQPCADKGLTIVQDRTGDVEKCVECDRNPACLCTACVAKKTGEVRKQAFDAGVLSGKPMR